MWQFRVDFKLPAYFWRKQRAAVNEQTFTAGEARHNYEAADLSIQARIRVDYSLAATARRLVDIYGKAAIPQARLALESSQTGYESGALDFLTVYSNLMSLVEYDLMYHEQIMQLHLALTRLEEMTGMELEP